MVSRRQVLAGLSAAIVTGFDPVKRAWVAEASASGAFDHIPALDGQLLTDPASIAAAGTDVGNIVHHAPIAVLNPGSARDVQKMVQFCAIRGISVAARGQGHATYGQAQAEGGLVIAMSSLNQIHSIGPTSVDIDGGATWHQLLQASVPQGVTPPALTGYTKLSIGGVLSMGGVSSTNAQGAVVDNVQALQVVTGRGDLVWCSEHQEPALFQGVLAGVGQLGIIVRAIVSVMPAPKMARTYLFNYGDNATFFKDFRLLINRGECDGVFNIGGFDPTGHLGYQLNVIKYFDPSHPPDDATLLRGLSQPVSAAQITDQTYLDQVFSVDVIIDFLQSIGLFDNSIHPWFDVFLPDSTVEKYVGDVLPTLQPEDIGQTGFLLLFALKRSKLKRPFLRIPEHTEWVYLFDILTAANTPGPDPTFTANMLARNRRLFEKARAVGGTRYPIGSVDFSHADWLRQYGPLAGAFALLKAFYDPRGIMTPGPGIFARGHNSDNLECP